jgi:hypothetical protein
MQTTTSRYLVLDGRARAIAQVSRTVAAQAAGRLQYLRDVSEAMDGRPRAAYLAFAVELGVIAALTRDIDAVASVDLLSTGDFTQKLVTLGVQVRRLP